MYVHINMGDGFGSGRGWAHNMYTVYYISVNVNSFPIVKQEYSYDNKS